MLDRRLLDAAARRLLLGCRDGCPECRDSGGWELEYELSSEADVVVRVSCEQHNHEREYRFTLEEMIAAVERGGDHTG